MIIIALICEKSVNGMSMGAAAAFMITGQSARITNLGAVKIVLDAKRFVLYIIYIMAFTFLSGLLVDLAVYSY